MLSFSPRDVLEEILNLIESDSEGFPTYSSTAYSLLSSASCRPEMTGTLLKRTLNRISCNILFYVLDRELICVCLLTKIN